MIDSAESERLAARWWRRMQVIMQHRAADYCPESIAVFFDRLLRGSAGAIVDAAFEEAIRANTISRRELSISLVANPTALVLNESREQLAECVHALQSAEENFEHEYALLVPHIHALQRMDLRDI